LSPAGAGDDKHPGADAAAVGSSPGSSRTQPRSPEAGSCTGGSSCCGRRCCVWLREHAALLIGMLMCQVGMILFNLGLTYGFSALSDITGTWLPTSFLALPYAPGSPYYSVAGEHALIRWPTALVYTSIVRQARQHFGPCKWRMFAPCPPACHIAAAATVATAVTVCSVPISRCPLQAA
jgi:hypothetical protein